MVSEVGRRSQGTVEGVLLALAAALAFGLTTPWIDRAARDLGPFTTAALLYAGAALVSLAVPSVLGRTGPRLSRSAAPRLLAIAFFGAFLAPVAFAWGLRRSGPTTASLLLCLEAVFTALLAAGVGRERVGRRVVLAIAAMTAGGALLALDRGRLGGASLAGALAVAAAAGAWAADNVLSRPLADREPSDVVRAKGALGALASGAVAFAAGEPAPAAAAVLALLACGATGYGLSLRLYLLAQRRVGAARTASVFAAAPFLGAAAAWALGDRAAGLPTLLGAGAFALGAHLHLTERHAHRHVHEPIEHEHEHSHDDDHHGPEQGHAHDPAVPGRHVHSHRHGRLEHVHDHAPDLHHHHAHESRGNRAFPLPRSRRR